MDTNTTFLAVTAMSVGVFHTLAGPDHYLPFVAMSKTRGWSMMKTIQVVIACGLGHVLSSVLIGFIGIGAGIAVREVEWFEGVRGNIAAWLLFLFGVLYTLWAVVQIARNRHHHHHEISEKRKMTFWILFTIFLFGPCEPLIPILMYPAAQNNGMALVLITGIFTVATVGTMILTVVTLLRGLSLVKMHVLERYQHFMAGSALAICGAGILFLGL